MPHGTICHTTSVNDAFEIHCVIQSVVHSMHCGICLVHVWHAALHFLAVRHGMHGRMLGTELIYNACESYSV